MLREQLGSAESSRCRAAGGAEEEIRTLLHIAWSLWLVAIGVFLLV